MKPPTIWHNGIVHLRRAECSCFSCHRICRSSDHGLWNRLMSTTGVKPTSNREPAPCNIVDNCSGVLYLERVRGTAHAPLQPGGTKISDYHIATVATCVLRPIRNSPIVVRTLKPQRPRLGILCCGVTSAPGGEKKIKLQGETHLNHLIVPNEVSNLVGNHTCAGQNSSPAAV